MGLPPGHKFPAEKYSLVRQCLEPDQLFEFVPALPAPLETIGLAHDPAYVHNFVSGTLPAQAIRRIGFPWTEGLVRRTLSSAGGTLAAAQDALDTGFGANLAGGTHHAFYSEGAGFCVFNDLAIAILFLRREAAIPRAAVIDLDVHQGDGTAALFASDPNVFTLSLHGRNNFPFRKQQSSLDIAFPDQTTDEAYLEALATALPRVFDFNPGVILYQSGVDALSTDRLGRLSLTPQGLAARDRLVFNAVRAARLPLILTLGGGYSDPIHLTAQAHANTYRLAAELLNAGNDRQACAESAQCASGRPSHPRPG